MIYLFLFTWHLPAAVGFVPYACYLYELDEDPMELTASIGNLGLPAGLLYIRSLQFQTLNTRDLEYFKIVYGN